MDVDNPGSSIPEESFLDAPFRRGGQGILMTLK